VATAGIALLTATGLGATALPVVAEEEGLRISPAKGVAGDLLTVSGTGLDGECDVLLRWGGADGQALGVAPVVDGSFTGQVSIPEGAARGAVSVVAETRAHGLPGQGCAAPSGRTTAGTVTVTGTAEPKGRTIALQNRRISTAGTDQPTLARAKASRTPIHAILQLHTLPRVSDLATLEDLGVRPLAYVNARGGSGTAYLAAIAPAVRAGDARFAELVRGLHPIQAQDKIEASLAARETGSQAAIDAQVTFFADVPAGTVDAVLDAEGVSPTARHGSHLVQALLSRGQLQRLALTDAVQFIAAAAPVGQLDLDTSRALVNADAVQGFAGNGIYTGLTGDGVQVSIHDSGVDLQHRDFENRWLSNTLDASGSDHGTHVASIAVGSGVMSDQDDDAGMSNGPTAYRWRGMAPQAGIAAFGSVTAHSSGTMQDAIVDDGVDVSNHSYSYNDGQYTGDMASIDGLIRGDDATVPGRPMIFSAGNQGAAPQYGENSSYFSLSKSCKNCVIVANQTGSDSLSQGSSHGPTPDGRLKPDVGAGGNGIVAAGADIDDDGNPATGNSYRSKSGTSMSTPAVTGVVALILQQFAEQGVDLDAAAPLPSTIKAVLVQTAIDQVGTSTGTNADTGAATVFGPGPDWATGYGLVDAEAAVELVAGGDLVEDAVSDAAGGHTDQHFVQVAPGQAELRVSLAWDDLPGTPNANHATPQLVNDLDLYLVGPNGELALPLVLPAAEQFDCDGDDTNGTQTGCAGPGADPGPWPSSTTAIDAAPGIDRLNNVEQVVLAAPAPGLWTAFVSVRNPDTSLRLPLGGTQAYSLAGVSEARADLSVTKTTSPDPIVDAGQELIYTVTVRNDGPDTATGVVVTDVLPAEVVYVANDAGCTFEAATRTLTCALGDLEAGGTASFQIKTVVRPDTVVTTGGHKDIVNTVTVGSGTPDLEPADNTFTRTTFVQESADLRVTKQCQPLDHQPAGNLAECTVYVDNLGPSYARSVTLTDVHSSDGAFTLGPVTPSQGSCSITGATVTCTLGTLANASPTTAGRATVRITISADEDVDVENLASVTAATPDPVTDNNSATGGVQFLASADLALTKTGPAGATAGTSFDYELAVSNEGPSTATGVVVADVLPLGMTIDAVVCSDGGTANPGQPGNPLLPTTCSFGTLADGAVRTMTVSVTVLPDTRGILHNNARADSEVLDPDLADNLATVATTVAGSADLSISKTDSPDPVVAGDPLSWTIVVTNDGPSTAFDVVVTDTLPAGTTFVSGQDGNGATVCALVQPGEVVCELGDLGPGESVTVYLTVDVDPSLDPGAVLSNTATVSSGTDDPDPTDNTVSEDTAVLTSAELWLDKQATLRSGNSSNVIVYSLVVHNGTGCETDAQSTATPTCGAGGPSDARDVVVVDDLPLTSKKFVVQYLSPQCTYDAATHRVTCSADNLPAGASVTFVVEGQVSGSVGTISNTATVSSSTADPVVANNTNAATIVHQGGTGGKGGGGGKGKP
jgi:uncharacterized repeat protein (TIGR01451 family)